MTEVALPTEINARVRVQSADTAGFAYLCWRGFHPEVVEFGGWITMRRDFHDGVISANYAEPPPPRFLIEILAGATRSARR